MFIDVENGTEVLLLAVRRDVGDLSLAHRVYDSMRKTQRWAGLGCTACLPGWWPAGRLAGWAASPADRRVLQCRPHHADAQHVCARCVSPLQGAQDALPVQIPAGHGVSGAREQGAAAGGECAPRCMLRAACLASGPRPARLALWACAPCTLCSSHSLPQSKHTLSSPACCSCAGISCRTQTGALGFSCRALDRPVAAWAQESPACLPNRIACARPTWRHVFCRCRSDRVTAMKTEAFKRRQELTRKRR